MRILALFMASAFLLGCSSTPLSPKGEAVYYALETDTLLRTWEESCKEVNLDVKQKALLTRQNWWQRNGTFVEAARSEEHTSELQSRPHLVCRLLLEKKKKNINIHT